MALGIVEPKTSVQPPGTEYLVDTAQTSGEHQYEHAHFKHGKGKKQDIVLVPQPSDDPDDPLLWPIWKREAAFVVLFFNSIIFAACPGPMIAPATVALATQLDVPVKKVAQLSGYQLLVVGALGPVVSVLAEKYGKRPQFLFASLLGTLGTGICIAGFDQSSLSKSYRVLLTGRMIQGLGTTAYESLAVAAIGDMFFLHRRGIRTSLLVLTTACLASFVAICAGHMFEVLGARNLFVVLLPLQLFGFVCSFLFIPETQFRRNERQGGMATEQNGLTVQDKAEASTHSITRDPAMSTVNSTTPKRTFVQDLRLTSGVYNHDSILKLLGRIFVHLLNPAIVWITLVAAILISFFVGTAYTLAQIFSPPPYLLTVSQNGYFFTGALLGGILGVISGPLCDFSAKTLSRRNKGVFEAEFRIPVNILAVTMLAVGWFTFMWALERPTLKGGVYLCSFCYGAVCFGTSVAGTSTGLYILDAFRPYATEIFILQMMIKNFLFYAFSTFINEFVAAHGPANMAKVWGIITVCGFVTCVPMYMFGKVNRSWVHHIYVKYLGDK
ncbi:serine/threonine kinase 16 [Paraphaeosphaeria sporulosa]|uniref:Serine/threonine kinase 16 n=1 Tax=Paraphaeosphaeria sporulosa TaxID=1460663 RepID=A0A177CV86_9PLEO|nr:serine/threonine kinase 16 [Paraphaeosphaeria sporulosa]OAG10928.1 serine/threonine kinase 16 [Paraphaeosphaeria sporulosa]